MGREATCTCIWNGKRGVVKALIEPPDLILRGELRQHIPTVKIQALKVEGDQLRFTIEGELISLLPGSATAAKWADALLKPQRTLAQKLGISADTIVWMIGPIDDPALETALAEAKSISRRSGQLIVARIDTPSDLIRLNAFRRSTRRGRSRVVHLPQGLRPFPERKPGPLNCARHRNRRYQSRGRPD
jgi:hypothetical protein